MNKDLLLPFVLSVVRHAVGALGATQVVSADEQHQIAGGIALALSIAWSIWDKVRAGRNQANRRTQSSE